MIYGGKLNYKCTKRLAVTIKMNLLPTIIDKYTKSIKTTYKLFYRKYKHYTFTQVIEKCQAIKAWVY